MTDKALGLVLMLRAPIMELMKTPSRTQTVKKTRAATTAMKEKGEKIRALNLQVGSPVSKASTPSVSAHAPSSIVDRWP